MINSLFIILFIILKQRKDCHHLNNQGQIQGKDPKKL